MTRALVAAALLVTMSATIAESASPVRSKGRSRPSSDARLVRSAPGVPTAEGVVHEVQRGETLSAIAKRYGVTVASLVIANRLRGSRARLVAGQRLIIPRPGGAPVLRARRGPVDEPLPVSLVLGLPEFDDAPAFQWPVAGPVTSTFGRRSRSWHRGVDIRADGGTPIVAAAPGVVVASGIEARYGLMVKIEHDGGFVTVYAHNERNLVEVGETVAAGHVIALVGRTGRATGEHVHFEIRYDGRVYNPLYLLPLPPRSVHVELAGAEPHDDHD